MQLQILPGPQDSDAGRAADELEALIREWAPDLALSRRPVEQQRDDDRKAIDPISVAALILAVPSAVLAVADIADRITKRRRAKQLIEQAHKLCDAHHVEIYITTNAGPERLDRIDPDALLLAAASANHTDE